MAAFLSIAPGADGGATLQASGGEIGGIVITADGSPAPVRHALVTLSGHSGATTVSDDAGAFTFANLTPGRYGLSVVKPGYARSRYGATEPGGEGIEIVVAAGQHLSALQLPLWRGAVITGTLTTSGGAPLAGVPVIASRSIVALPSGMQTLYDQAEAVSNSDGVYRIYGLPDGDFVVTARPRLPGEREGADESYPPTSYPGVANIAEAPVISVTSGEERAGIDINLRAARPSVISGSVIETDGRPATGLEVWLLPSSMDARANTVEDLDSSRTPVRADGTFSFPPAFAGSYTVLALRSHATPDDSAKPGTRPLEWARIDVTVDGSDASGLQMVLKRGTPISGRVVFDLIGSRADVPAEIALLGNRAAGLMSVRGAVEADGSWTINSVVPGQYRVEESRSTAEPLLGIRLRSATLAGRDVIHDTFEVGGEPVSGIVVTFTDKIGAAHGRLTDAAGQAATSFTVFVIPKDQSAWPAFLRAPALARPDTNGDWSIGGLPPGEYLVAAVAGIRDSRVSSLITLDFLGQLSAAAAPITVAAGSSTTIDLRIGR